MLRELSEMEQRYQAVLAIQVDGLTVTEVAEKWGVSRQTVHTWLRRYEDAGLEGLADPRLSPTSSMSPLPRKWSTFGSSVMSPQHRRSRVR